MTRLSQTVIWGAIAALILALAPLLARDLMAMTQHVALDPNEGWNAAHTLRLMMGGPLYPPKDSWMVNNYPPLSFYLVAGLTHLTHDAVIAGRLVSALSFVAICGLIAMVLRQWGAKPQATLLGTLFFAAVLLIDTDYVAMDDPQLLGHAVQMAALLLLLRRKNIAAAALFAISLFIKHNLLAMPLAASLWLLLQDRRAGLHFLVWGAAFALTGLAAFQWRFGVSLLSMLTTPRATSATNLWQAMTHLWWAVLPGWLSLYARPGGTRSFAHLYTGTALALGVIFAIGDGVDTNAFFDLAIALALVIGLMPDHKYPTVIAGLSALPLLIFLVLHWHDNNFFYTRTFAAQSQRDIAFLKARPGPALCDQMSLCLWAGKTPQIDVFNAGEAIQTKTRNAAPLIQMIQAHHFATIQLQDTQGLGPQIHAAITSAYRLHHHNDNGAFFTP